MMKKILWSFCFVLIAFFQISNAVADHIGGCSIDINIQTHQYDHNISSLDIESQITADPSDKIWIAVVAQNMTDFDTYEIEIHYDANSLSFEGGYEDSPMMGIDNLLKLNSGKTIGFQAVESKQGVINIANSLIGTDINEAPEGSGVIAILQFSLLSDVVNSRIRIYKVNFLNSSQNKISVQKIEDAVINPQIIDFSMDINQNGRIELMDAIIGLHSCADTTLFQSDILVTTVKVLQTLVDIPVKEQRQAIIKQKRIAL
jgi:hypothetical protein